MLLEADTPCDAAETADMARLGKCCDSLEEEEQWGQTAVAPRRYIRKRTHSDLEHEVRPAMRRRLGACHGGWCTEEEGREQQEAEQEHDCIHDTDDDDL